MLEMCCGSETNYSGSYLPTPSHPESVKRTFPDPDLTKQKKFQILNTRLNEIKEFKCVRLLKAESIKQSKMPTCPPPHTFGSKRNVNGTKARQIQI